MGHTGSKMNICLPGHLILGNNTWYRDFGFFKDLQKPRDKKKKNKAKHLLENIIQ